MSILDYGCGTGSLTRPLAASYPLIDFLGVDADWATVVRAKASNLPRNLSFDLPSRLDVCGSFGLIIVSEVLEHAEEPGQLLLLLRPEMAVGFGAAKCSACELCCSVCPARAMEVRINKQAI